MVRSSSVVVLLVALAYGCGGSMGKLVNPQRDPRTFVTDRQSMLVQTDDGLVRVSLDGAQRERLAGPGFQLETSTADGRVLVLGDSKTNLFLLGPESREIRQVHELDGRAGKTAVRPDGAIVAATRHADYSLPQRDWHTTEDDAVYLIDTRTLAVDVILKSRREHVAHVRWEAGHDALILEMRGGDTVRLDLTTRARTVLGTPPQIPPIYAGSERCTQTGDTLALRGDGGAEGLDLITSTGRRRLVIVEGRSRGFHDYRSTVNSMVFTPSCRYVVFELGQSVWVADVSTGTIGHVTRGWSPRLLRP